MLSPTQVHGRLRAGGTATRPHRVHRGRFAGAADREQGTVSSGPLEDKDRARDCSRNAVRARCRYLPSRSYEQGLCWLVAARIGIVIMGQYINHAAAFLSERAGETVTGWNVRCGGRGLWASG